MDYKMQVVLDNKTIDVIIEHKQNKNLYIRVTDNLELLVTCNKRVSEKEILSVIKKNEKSLINMYLKKEKELDNNSIFYYLGKPYTIIYNKDIKKYDIIDDCIIVKDEKMKELVLAFISRGKYGLYSIIGKVLTTHMICNHPELSDKKVKDITNIMS